MNMIIMIALFMIVINLVSNAAVSFSSGGIISSIALSIILFGFALLFSRVKGYHRMKAENLEQIVLASYNIIINSNSE